MTRETTAGDLVLDCLIDGMVRLLCQPPARPDRDRLHMSPAQLALVKAHIEEHLAQQTNLEELAGVAGLSVFHFARVFKQASGQSPHSYVMDRRLARACTLLRMPAMPLAAIAGACGFARQPHSTSAFRKSMGVTPGRYRRVLLDQAALRRSGQCLPHCRKRTRRSSPSVAKLCRRPAMAASSTRVKISAPPKRTMASRLPPGSGMKPAPKPARIKRLNCAASWAAWRR